MMGAYPEFESCAARVIEACTSVLGASSGCISMLGGRGKEKDVVRPALGDAGCSADSFQSDPVRRLRNSARRTGRAAYRNDLQKAAAGVPARKGSTRTRNALVAPLMEQGKLTGFLGLFDKPGGFDDEDARFASAFGEIASIALRNSREAAALRASEIKYRIIADNAHDWEWWLAPDGRFIYMSSSCEPITGYDPAKFVNEPDLIGKVVHPDDRGAFAQHRDEVDRTLEGGSAEFRIVRPDGTHRWISHVCRPVFDETGRFVGHRGSNRDITPRWEAQDALRRSEVRLRELSTQLLRAQEEGRKRVAREIHDGVNQTLTAIKFAMESRLAQMPADSVPPGVSLEKIISMVQLAIDEARRIQMDLRPPLLDDLGILATLSWFTREFENVYKHIRVERTIEAAEEDVPHLLKIVIFRIVQEALNNVAKHSGAKRAVVTLRPVDGGIELTVADNGRGFDIDTPSPGFGLMNMRERAELSGGTFEIRSACGRGTSIKAFWPPRQW